MEHVIIFICIQMQLPCLALGTALQKKTYCSETHSRLTRSMSRLKRLVVYNTPRGQVFDLRQGHVGFKMDKVSWGQFVF
jgi:hypothetical protein